VAGMGDSGSMLESLASIISENNITADQIHYYFKPMCKESTTCKHIYCMNAYNNSQYLCSMYHRNCGPCFISIREFIRNRVIPKMSEEELLQSINEDPGDSDCVYEFFQRNRDESIMDDFALKAGTDITILHIPEAMKELISISERIETDDALNHVIRRREKRKRENENQKWQKKLRANPGNKIITAK